MDNLTKIFKSYSQTFTTHYACRNADLKLTLDTGTTNGFITQTISSLIESKRGGGGGLHDLAYDLISFLMTKPQ